MVGLLEPSAGTIALDGRTLSEDPVAYKRQIGYVPEEPYLYTHLTATEYLTLVGRLRGMPQAPLDDRIARLLRLFQLHDSRYSTMAAYSKGMRQRVLLAAALLHNPDLLVLDEPFSGPRRQRRPAVPRAARPARRRRPHDSLQHAPLRHGREAVLARRHPVGRASRRRAARSSAMRSSGAPSLEDTFVRVTEQPDFTPVAREILDTICEA